MEKIKCLVLDEDPAFCNLVASYIVQHPDFELSGKFTDSDEAKEFVMRNRVALVFLDIKLTGTTGFDFLRSISYKPFAVFLTSSPDFALESYELNTIDYILKPVKKERIFAVLNKAVEVLENKMEPHFNGHNGNAAKLHDGYFFIQTKNQYVKVFHKDILFVKAIQNFAQIVVHDKEKSIYPLINLKQLASSLPAEIFLRVHKSYIVNINQVSAISKKGLLISDEIIPIGDGIKNTVVKRIVKKTLIKK